MSETVLVESTVAEVIEVEAPASTIEVTAQTTTIEVGVDGAVVEVSEAGSSTVEVVAAGPQGPVGAQGPAGDAGAAGPKGDKGDPGDPLTELETTAVLIAEPEATNWGMSNQHEFDVALVGALGQYIPASEYSGQGAILTGSDGGGYSSLLPGIDGQVLTADSSTYKGVSWQEKQDSLLLLPRATADFGNGLDGRIPAVNCAQNALGGGYVVGPPCPWTSVDVWMLWVESGISAGSNVVLSAYLQSLTDDSEMKHTLIANKLVTPTTTKVVGTRYYHETQVATGVATAPGRPLAGTMARYGAEATDTYEQAIALVALLIAKH